jgi:hypothetical protein
MTFMHFSFAADVTKLSGQEPYLFPKQTKINLSTIGHIYAKILELHFKKLLNILLHICATNATSCAIFDRQKSWDFYFSRKWEEMCAFQLTSDKEEI